MKNLLNIEIRNKKIYNYALINSGYKMVDHIIIKNPDNISYSNLELRIRSNPEFLSGDEKISFITPCGIKTFSSDFISIDNEKIKLISSPVNVLVLCEIIDENGNVIADCDKSITITPYNYFTGFYDAPESLAFYITPHQDIIQRLADDMASDKAFDMLSRVYQFLKTEKLTFVQENYFEYSHKKIRLPEEVLLSKIANSLEIAILISALFENKGFMPYIVASQRGKVYFYLDDSAKYLIPLSKFDSSDIDSDTVVIDAQYFAYGSDMNFETALYNSRNSISFSDEKFLVLNISEIRKMHIIPLPDRIDVNGSFILADEQNTDSSYSFDSYYDFVKRFSNDSRVKSILTSQKLHITSSKINSGFDNHLDINQNKILNKILSNDLTLIKAQNGSGKTTLFANAAKSAIKNKKSVLYLTDDLNSTQDFSSISSGYFSSVFTLDLARFFENEMIGKKFDGIFKGKENSYESVNKVSEAYKTASDYYSHIDGGKNIVDSFYIASEKYNQYRDANDCVLFSPTQIGALSDSLVKEWFNIVSEISNSVSEIKTVYKNPLSFIKYSNFTYEYKSKLFSKLEEILRSIEKYIDTRSEALQYFPSLGEILSYNANSTFYDLMRLISDLREFPAQFFIDPSKVEENFQNITKLIQLKKDNSVKLENLFMAFNEDILGLDAEETLALWKSANADKSIKSFSLKHQVIKSVKKYLMPNCDFENIDLVLNNLCEYHKNKIIIDEMKENAFRILGIDSNDENAWEILREKSEFCYQVYSVYRSHFELEKLSEFAPEVNNACKIDSFSDKANEYIEAYEIYNQLKTELQEIVFSEINSFYSSAMLLDADYFDVISKSLNELLLSLDNLKSWCNWLNVRQKAIDIGVKNIVNCLENGKLEAPDIKKSFVRGFFKAICENCFIEYPDIVPEAIDFDSLLNSIKDNEIGAKEALKFEMDAILSIERIDALNHIKDGISFADPDDETLSYLQKAYPVMLGKYSDAKKIFDNRKIKFDYVLLDTKSKIKLIDILWLFDHSEHIAFAGNFSEPYIFDADSFDLEFSAFDYLWKITDEKYSMSCVYKNSPEMVDKISKFSDALRKDSRCYSAPAINNDNAFSLVRVHGFYDVDYKCANLQEAEWAIDYIRKFLISDMYSLSVVSSTKEQTQLVIKMLAKMISENEEYKELIVENKKRISVFSVNDQYISSDETVFLFTFASDKSVPGAKLPYEIASAFSSSPENTLAALISSARSKFIICSSIDPSELNFTTSVLPTMSYLSLIFDLADEQISNSSYEIISPENASKYVSRLKNDLQDNGFKLVSGVKNGRYYIDLAVLDKDDNFILGIISDATVLNQSANVFSVEYLNLCQYNKAGWKIYRLRSNNLFDSYERELDKILNLLGFDLYSKELK